MAAVTIQLKDKSGGVGVSVVFDPPLDMRDDEALATPAEALAAKVVEFLGDGAECS